VAALLVAWVDAAGRRPRTVLAGVGAMTIAAAVVAALWIGVDADTKNLLDPDLPSQRRDREFAAAFPTLTESLLVVLDGESAESVRGAASDLADHLSGQPALFPRVFVPGAGAFFERYGLLYRSLDELEVFADRLAELQPILAELTASPTLPTLTRVIEQGLSVTALGSGGAARLGDMLNGFGEAAVAVYAEHPISVSWESVLLAGSSLDPTRRMVLVVDPALDFDSILSAQKPIDAIRSAGAELGLAERGVELRITGYPALIHEELLGLLWDVGIAGVASFLLVLLILWFALRSRRLVAAAAVTLLVGMVWTGAFAALSVGDLNLVSISVAVLFIGLGVDFAIHLGLHYAEIRRSGREHADSMAEAVGMVGQALALCTASTAIGFFAFVPTDYRGVGELGLIAGVGMLVIFSLTLTLFPVLVGAWCTNTPLPAAPHVPAAERSLSAWLERHAGLVIASAGALGIASAFLAPGIRFDSNVVKMRNPSTESVRAFEDLLRDGDRTPWFVDVVAPDLGAADAAARELAELPEVERTATLSDYVPSDQDEKLDLLADLAFLLDVPGRVSPDEPDTAEQVAALQNLALALEVEWVDSSDAPLARSALLLRRRLANLLSHLEDDRDPEAELAELDGLLLARLPERLAALRRALEPGTIQIEDLPADLVSRMRDADDRARIQVFPREDMRDDRALSAFVAAVRTLEPEATGLPVNIVEFGRATSSSLQEALGWALGLIGLLLFALWRRPVDALLVLAPLGLAGLLTIGTMIALDEPLNFVNVIVLPLLLGIGVDSGIHLVQRSRFPLLPEEPLAGTVTGRAVLWSAFTTLASFSTLALSGHRGIASLGQLLVLGMAATLLCMLVVLPALLHRLGRVQRAPTS
jgi:hopanoid biosynthesis associated RND transporter like protein HpnN